MLVYSPLRSPNFWYSNANQLFGICFGIQMQINLQGLCRYIFSSKKVYILALFSCLKTNFKQIIFCFKLYFLFWFLFVSIRNNMLQKSNLIRRYLVKIHRFIVKSTLFHILQNGLTFQTSTSMLARELACFENSRPVNLPNR